MQSDAKQSDAMQSDASNSVNQNNFTEIKEMIEGQHDKTFANIIHEQLVIASIPNDTNH